MLDSKALLSSRDTMHLSYVPFTFRILDRYVLLKAKMTAHEISDAYLEWCSKKASWRFPLALR